MRRLRCNKPQQTGTKKAASVQSVGRTASALHEVGKQCATDETGNVQQTHVAFFHTIMPAGA